MRVTWEGSKQPKVIERWTDQHKRARRAGRRTASENQQQPSSNQEDKLVDASVEKIRGRRQRGRKGKAYESKEITTKALALAEDEEMRQYTCTCMMRGEMVRLGRKA